MEKKVSAVKRACRGLSEELGRKRRKDFWELARVLYANIDHAEFGNGLSQPHDLTFKRETHSQAQLPKR